MRYKLLSALLLPLLFACGQAGTAEPRACVKGGCSNHLCFELGPNEDMPASTCEWTDAYGCYADLGICERQPSGECGFTPTKELTACLRQPAAGGAAMSEPGSAQ